MGLSFDLFVANVTKDMLCSVCTMVLDYPVRTPCNHVFCQACFRKMTKDFLVCPICRVRLVDQDNVIPDSNLNRRILSMESRCDARDCDWRGNVAARLAHIHGCLHVEVPCDYAADGCIMRMKRSDLAKHIAECSMRPTTCVHCHMLLPSAELNEHVSMKCEVAPTTIVSCPENCGAKIARGQVAEHLYKSCEKRGGTCEFKILGCNDAVVRELRKEHSRNQVAAHFELLVNLFMKRELEFEKLQKRVEKSEEEITNLHNLLNAEKENRQSNDEILEKKIQANLGAIKHSASEILGLQAGHRDSSVRLGNIERKLPHLEAAIAGKSVVSGGSGGGGGMGAAGLGSFGSSNPKMKLLRGASSGMLLSRQGSMSSLLASGFGAGMSPSSAGGMASPGGGGGTSLLSPSLHPMMRGASFAGAGSVMSPVSRQQTLAPLGALQSSASFNNNNNLSPSSPNMANFLSLSAGVFRADSPGGGGGENSQLSASAQYQAALATMHDRRKKTRAKTPQLPTSPEIGDGMGTSIQDVESEGASDSDEDSAAPIDNRSIPFEHNLQSRLAKAKQLSLQNLQVSGVGTFSGHHSGLVSSPPPVAGDSAGGDPKSPRKLAAMMRSMTLSTLMTTNQPRNGSPEMLSQLQQSRLLSSPPKVATQALGSLRTSRSSHRKQRKDVNSPMSVPEGREFVMEDFLSGPPIPLLRPSEPSVLNMRSGSDSSEDDDDEENNNHNMDEEEQSVATGFEQPNRYKEALHEKFRKENEGDKLFNKNKKGKGERRRSNASENDDISSNIIIPFEADGFGDTNPGAGDSSGLGDTMPEGIQQNTIIVDKENGPCKTISQALQEAGIGDMILVKPGTYIESLLIEKPVTIMGDGDIGDIIIDAAGKDTVVFDTPVAHLQNFTIRQNTSGYWCCIDIISGEPSVEHCDLSSASLTCISVHHKHTSPHISRVKIHDCAGVGISFFDHSDGLIEDCDIYGCIGSGVEISEGSNPLIRHSRINANHGSGVVIFENGRGILEDNDIFRNDMIGVEIREHSNPTLRRNEIHRHQGNSGVYVISNGRGFLSKNNVFENSRHGISVRDGAKPVCRHNRFAKNGEFGVSVGVSGWGTYEDNDLRDNGRGGIFIVESSVAKVINEGNITTG